MELWYAIVVASRKEMAIASLFRERGICVFLPMAKTWSRFPRSRKGCYREIPLVPGYIFIAEPNWRLIAELRGRNRFIRSPVRDIDGYPLPARPAAMAEFMDHCANGRATPQKRGVDGVRVWRVGETAQIAQGALVGHKGRLTAIRGRAARIMLALFGGEREVRISVAALDET